MAFIKEEAKDRIQQLVNEFNSKEDYYWKTDEANIETKLIEPLFEALGWTKKDFEKREKVAGKTGRKKIADYAFKVNDRILFFLEAKRVSVDIETDENTWRQAISYALSKRVPFAVLTNFRSMKVFCVEQENAAQNIFRYFKCKDFVERFNELWLLSKDSFEKDEMLHTAESEGRLKKRITIDDQLLEDFITSRRKIVASLEKNYPSKYNTEEKEDIAQRLLGRLIFIRKAEDIGINVDNESRDIALLEEITELPDNEAFPKLKRIFQKYEEVFDSELFMQMYDKDLAHTEIEGKIVKELVKHLYYSRNGELVYNFDWITSDVLGNVYEQYLGNIIKETARGAKAEESRPHRKEQGIYYTPTYIVDYIVRNTLGELIKNKKPSEVDKIRVLDPACGSGSFLIKAFDILNEYYAKKDKNYSQTQLDATGEGATYSRKLRILENNIFGVDLDNKAVEISQLNLLLKIAEKKHRLPLLKDNIKVGNSLIDDPVISNKAFKWEEQFPAIKEGGFDVIVGNPPYIQLSMEDSLRASEKEYLINRFKSSMGRLNTFGFFIKLGMDLLQNDGILGFIVPNTILTQDYYEELREMILNSSKIKAIATFSNLPFKEAVVENVIIVLQKTESQKDRLENIIRVFDVDEKLNFVEAERIKQNYFFQNNKKTFNVFIDKSSARLKKKMESSTKPLGEFFSINQAIALKHERAKSLSKRKEGEDYKPVIDGRHINRYSLKWEGDYLAYNIDAIHSCKREDIFLSPEKLFFRRVGDHLIATLDDKKFYALNTLVVMNKKPTVDMDIRYFLALFNSKLLNYYYQTFLKSTKKVFSEIQARQVKNLPIKVDSEYGRTLITLVDKMLSLNKRLNEIGDKRTDEWVKINDEIEKTSAEIDELVYRLYGITEKEKKIIEDSLK